MKRHFCNFFTAALSIFYIINVLPNLVSAFLSNNTSFIIQELVFILPYCIGNFIIAIILINSSFKKPVKTDESIKSTIISFLGTNIYVIATWFINFRNPNPNLSVLYLATLLQVFIQLFYLLALLNLGLSLTVLPEARELKTKGIYSISRHPLYSSYMLINILNVFVNQSLIYIPMMLLCNYLQYLRAKSEEKVLLEVFPEYEEYKKNVMFIGKSSWFRIKKK